MGKRDGAQVGTRESSRLLGISMKWVSLVALTLQTSAQVFVMKWAMNAVENNGNTYSASVVVLLTEMVKMGTSLALEVRCAGGLTKAVGNVYDQFRGSRWDMMKVCVPSLLYTLQ